MIFNQKKYQWQNNNIEITVNILSSMVGDIYPYQYMDDWGKFKEIWLPSIESFHSYLNKECIGKLDHAHASRLWDTFEIKNIGDYHDLYV